MEVGGVFKTTNMYLKNNFPQLLRFGVSAVFVSVNKIRNALDLFVRLMAAFSNNFLH